MEAATLPRMESGAYQWILAMLTRVGLRERDLKPGHQRLRWKNSRTTKHASPHPNPPPTPPSPVPLSPISDNTAYQPVVGFNLVIGIEWYLVTSSDMRCSHERPNGFFVHR
ncbi:uncharacterized protein BO80DRAFT_506522 [Aspergillus ibericus CBS 121593]|uniref:Uncharacterized protein n=1 Tax=Aspergillus ibericus CBS 121593 TaxID=1448316 RepID=A0A395GJH0_9EURO|nr:hypothetical protein BO80DRAFT_506522 [Aspergillus ibericus CBS 121593]RAK94907.1 hypothetical protein BO80DRAFT_506522 [Aspergillus ibericus CBS 121593]